MRKLKRHFYVADSDTRRYYKYHRGVSRQEGGGPQVTEMLEKFRKWQLPPHQERALGLEKGWKEKVTKEFAEHVYNAAVKHQNAIRELQKY